MNDSNSSFGFTVHGTCKIESWAQVQRLLRSSCTLFLVIGICLDGRSRRRLLERIGVEGQTAILLMHRIVTKTRYIIMIIIE